MRVMETAYRNGNGNVILGIKSSFDGTSIEYNLYFVSNSDYKNWANKKLQWIKNIEQEKIIDSEDKILIIMLLNNMKNNSIIPITIASNTPK